MHRCRVTRRRHRRLKQVVHEGQQLACLASSSSSDEEAEVHVVHSDDVETDLKKWFDYSTNAGGFTQLVWTGAGLDVSQSWPKGACLREIQRDYMRCMLPATGLGQIMLQAMVHFGAAGASMGAKC